VIVHEKNSALSEAPKQINSGAERLVFFIVILLKTSVQCADLRNLPFFTSFHFLMEKVLESEIKLNFRRFCYTFFTAGISRFTAEEHRYATPTANAIEHGSGIPTAIALSGRGDRYGEYPVETSTGTYTRPHPGIGDPLQ